MPPPIPSLDRPFAELTARVRRRRAVRGAGVAAASIVGLAGAAVVVDVALGLPQLMRCVLCVLWVYYSVLLVNRFVRRPLRESVPVADLAGAVESRYPAFSERLLTLTSNPTGSKHLVGQLAKEADRQARVVESKLVSPGRAIGGVAVAGALLVVAALAAVPLVPGASGYARRFALPWYEPRDAPAFRVVVTSGRPFVRRGDALSLTAVLERIRPGVAFPPTLDVTTRDGDGKETTRTMAGDDRGAYVLTRPNVRADFDYRVRSERGDDEWYAVTVADAVELTDASTVTIRPPEYAKAVAPSRTVAGFGAFECVRFAEADFSFAFDRKPETVRFEFVATDGTARNVPVALANDGTARASLVVRESGTLKLAVTGERGIPTVSVAAVTAVADSPPRFVAVEGLSARAVEIRPGERLPLGVAVADDFGVAALVLEYRLATSTTIQSQSLPAVGLGTSLAEGRFAFDTTGKGAAGETLFLRLRATDARAVPGERLGPQDAFYPAHDWLPLTITASARPLAEQNIFGQRDAVAERLTAAARKAGEAKAEVLAASSGPPGRTRLTDDQLVRLRNARERAAEATDELAGAAREAGLIPELAAVAAEASAVAAGPVAVAVEATNRAERQPEAAPRTAELDAAYARFAEAIRRIEAALAANERVARERLDKRTLDDLAGDEREVATAAGTTKSAPEAAALAAKQRDIKDRLATAVRESEGLRATADESARRRAADLAADAKRLREEFDRLDRDRRKAESDALAARNAGLATNQETLAKHAAAVSERAKASAPATGATPPNPAPAAAAAEKFAAGDPLGAMAEQESAARELDRAADELERAVAARHDPKEAAKQIAKWQGDLAGRYAEATKATPPSDLPPHVRDRFAAEQKAIREAVNGLNVPPAEAGRKAEASAKANDAAERLARNDPAGVALREAARATATLAEHTPARADRLKLARGELNRQIDEQANVTRDGRELAKAPADPAKLAALAERQHAVARAVGSLDVPGLESRRDRAAESASSAARDLKAGRSHDLNASQAEARLQLDRLKQAVEGHEPADAVADRLARRQRDLADATDRLTPHSPPAETDRLGELEREINRDLANLTPPESPTLANAAKDAARAAEQAARRNANPKPDVDELKKKTRAAADALDALANRLNAAESDAGRVERLLRDRERAVVEAKRNAGKPVSPDAHAEAVRRTQADHDELDRTRTGDAAKEKADALDALKKLAQTPDPDRRAELQRKAADALAKLHAAVKADPDRRAVSPRPDPTVKPDFDAKTAPGLPTQDVAAHARDLAARQRAARDDASRAAAAGAGQGPGGEARKKQEAEFAKRLAELADGAKDGAAASGISQSESGTRTAGAMTKAAAESGRAATHADRATRESAAGRPDSAALARSEVKAGLDGAAAALADAAGGPATGTGTANGPDSGKAWTEMAKAEARLAANDPAGAAKAAKAAADALAPPAPQNASRPPPKPGDTPNSDPAPKPDAAAAEMLPPDLKTYTGVPWGDLPGDVKSKIVSDLSARYGEDYARVIKLYFEQIADPK